MSAASLNIELWENKILVPGHHPAPWQARDQVALVTHKLEEDLAELLDGYLAAHDGEVIVIRRLELAIDLDLALDPQRAARGVARCLVRRLAAAIETRTEDVVCFASERAYRAQFIEETAQGRATGQWCFRRFSGLAVLPSGAAIRTVLLETPAEAAPILGLIADAAWPAVLAALPTPEAERILHNLAASVDGTGTALDYAALLEAACALHALTTLAPAQVAVRLLGLLAKQEQTPGPRDIPTIAAVALAVHAQATRHAGLLTAIESGAACADAFGPESFVAHVLATLAVPSNAPMRALARAALRLDERPFTTGPAPGATPSPALPSHAAGLVILLDELNELFADLQPACLAPRAGACHAGSLGLAILALAAGPARFGSAWHDPVWRRILSVSEVLGWEEFVAALRNTEIVDRLHDSWRVRTQAQATSEPRDLRFPGRASRVLVRADWDSGLWQDCVILPAPRQKSDSRCNDPGRGAEKPWIERMAATRRARADWLDLSAAFADPSTPEATLLPACAQYLWRRVAQRVLGMSGASLDYLRANLLPLHAICTSTGSDHWQLRLDRARLHVLLAMTRLTRRIRVPTALVPCQIDLEFV
jgi:hypothetical protein